MIINCFLIVLEQGVGVPQAVAGLRFHSSVLQLPSQLQRPPAGEGQSPQKPPQGKAFRSAHARLKISYTTSTNYRLANYRLRNHDLVKPLQSHTCKVFPPLQPTSLESRLIPQTASFHLLFH